MQISGKHKGDLTQLVVKANNTNDGQEAEVDVVIGFSRERAEQCGDEFAKLAFALEGTYVGDDGTESIAQLVDALKPSRRVVFPKHVIEVLGHRIDEQPKLLKLQPVDGRSEVLATIRIPVEVGDKNLIGTLAEAVGGRPVDIEFQPQQGVLSFPGARAGRGEETQAAAN